MVYSVLEFSEYFEIIPDKETEWEDITDEFELILAKNVEKM